MCKAHEALGIAKAAASLEFPVVIVPCAPITASISERYTNQRVSFSGV